MAKGLNRHPGKAKLSFIFSEISRKPRPQGNGSDLSSISTGPATLGFFWIGKVSFVSERRSGLCTISEELMQNGRDLFEFRGFIEEMICASGETFLAILGIREIGRASC